MRNKILNGHRKNPNKNELIGGHSSQITNTNPNYAVEEVLINADGTRKVVYFPTHGMIQKLLTV